MYVDESNTNYSENMALTNKTFEKGWESFL